MFIKGIIAGLGSPKAQVYQEGNLLPVMRSEQLLNLSRHQALLRQLKESSGLPQAHFQALYLSLIDAFVEFVQVLPVDMDSPLGGIMNRSLARGVIALQAYQLGHSKTVDSRISYAVFSAALFQDVSRVIINQRVLLTQEDGEFIAFWNPFSGSMVGICEYYRLIRLAPVYQRLDYTLRHLFARELMPKIGYEWIASDLGLLADWFDAISGDSRQGGVLAHSLSIVKNEDVMALEHSLSQVTVAQKHLTEIEHGQAFYRWLQERIESGLQINTLESGLFITQDGLFIERPKVFKEFVEQYNQPVSIAVVYEQFGNLMGIVKKGGFDFMNAQYFSDAQSMSESGSRNLSSLMGSRQHTLRDGMVLSDPAMILNSAKIPAVSPLLRQMQRQTPTGELLPSLSDQNSKPSPSFDPKG